MLREVQDADGTTWSLAQAYAGLATSSEEKEEKSEAAAGSDENGNVKVVATPSGGAQTVRLELPGDWENRLSDEDLLGEIKKQSEPV